MAAARRRAAPRGSSREAKVNEPRDPHPDKELARLVARLKGGLPPLVVLRGEERYYHALGTRAVVAAADAAELEVCRHDALDPDYSAARLLDDLATGALFGAARCVVLLNAERVVVERAKSYSEAIRDAMLARLAARAAGCILLTAEKLTAAHPLVKGADEAGGIVVGFRRLYATPPSWAPDPRRAELVEWLVGRARARRLPLSPDHAAYVVAATGNDLAALDAQLDRLASAGTASLREVIGWESDASPYEVAEHLVMGRTARALAGIETLFRGGATQRDGSRVLDEAGIANQFAVAISSKLREALAGSAARERGLDERAVASLVKGRPQAVQEYRARYAARDSAAWARMLEELGQVERRARSGAGADASDFALLALRWRRDPPRRGAGPK